MLNELKTAIIAYVRNISQADLQEVFANKIKWVQACIDTRGHHFQRLLSVHSDYLNALYLCYEYVEAFQKADPHPRSPTE